MSFYDVACSLLCCHVMMMLSAELASAELVAQQSKLPLQWVGAAEHAVFHPVNF